MLPRREYKFSVPGYKKLKTILFYLEGETSSANPLVSSSISPPVTAVRSDDGYFKGKLVLKFIHPWHVIHMQFGSDFL